MRRFVFMIAVIVFLGSGTAVAQKNKVMTNPYADHKILHFGFSVGMHLQDLLFSHSALLPEQAQQWFVEIPSVNPGFNVGLIADLALHEYVNFRVVPTLYFGSKEVWLREWNSGEVVKQDLRSNYLSIPLLFKFSSRRLNNLRPYLLAGVSINADLSRRKNEPLLLKPVWMGIELGVGSNFYFPYFKFCPEIKFCLGMTNVLETDRSDITDPDTRRYTDALSKITSRLFVFTLNFE